jgi:hypothetical protein
MFLAVVHRWAQPWGILRCGFTKFREVVSRLKVQALCERRVAIPRPTVLRALGPDQAVKRPPAGGQIGHRMDSPRGALENVLK